MIAAPRRHAASPRCCLLPQGPVRFALIPTLEHTRAADGFELRVFRRESGGLMRPGRGPAEPNVWPQCGHHVARRSLCHSCLTWWTEDLQEVYSEDRRASFFVRFISYKDSVLLWESEKDRRNSRTVVDQRLRCGGVGSLKFVFRVLYGMNRRICGIRCGDETERAR
jgi:hypothetical protein